MKLIKYTDEGDSLSGAFINWRKYPHYFSVIFFIPFFEKRFSFSIRVRWMECDNPFRIIFKFHKWSKKDERIMDEFCKGVERLYLTDEIIRDIGLTDNQVAKMKAFHG